MISEEDHIPIQSSLFRMVENLVLLDQPPDSSKDESTITNWRERVSCIVVGKFHYILCNSVRRRWYVSKKKNFRRGFFARWQISSHRTTFPRVRFFCCLDSLGTLSSSVITPWTTIIVVGILARVKMAQTGLATLVGPFVLVWGLGQPQLVKSGGIKFVWQFHPCC